MITSEHMAVTHRSIVARHNGSGTFDIDMHQKETQGGWHGSAN